MRTDFHRQLDLLNADLTAMCDLAATAIRRATDALLHTDLGAAEHALAGIEQLRRLNLNVDRRALSLLARQAPVAGDLRAVVSAVQIGADADRMGGLAAHVAAAVRRRHPAPVLPTQIAPRFAEMGRIAASLADAAREVVLDGDPVAAARIRADDADMDAQHRLLLAALSTPAWCHGTPAAVDIVLLARFYERIADHAAEIGRRVIFRPTGANTADTQATPSDTLP
jgi:phosphate transport system protein